MRVHPSNFLALGVLVALGAALTFAFTRTPRPVDRSREGQLEEVALSSSSRPYCVPQSLDGLPMDFDRVVLAKQQRHANRQDLKRSDLVVVAHFRLTGGWDELTKYLQRLVTKRVGRTDPEAGTGSRWAPLDTTLRARYYDEYGRPAGIDKCPIEVSAGNFRVVFPHFGAKGPARRVTVEVADTTFMTEKFERKTLDFTAPPDR